MRSRCHGRSPVARYSPPSSYDLASCLQFVRSRSCSVLPRVPGLRDPARAAMLPAGPTPPRSLACRPMGAPVHEPKDRGLAATVARSCLPASRMTGQASPPRRRCLGPRHRCPRRPSGSSARPSAAAVASARCSLGASLRIWPEDSSPTSATTCGLAGGASERVATRSLPLAPGRSTSSPAAWSWSQPSPHRPARPTHGAGCVLARAGIAACAPLGPAPRIPLPQPAQQTLQEPVWPAPDLRRGELCRASLRDTTGPASRRRRRRARCPSRSSPR